MNERFKELFSLLDVKDSEVAKTCDISVRTVSRLKHNVLTALPVSALYNLHVAYDVNLNWLIAGNGDKFCGNKDVSGISKVQEPRTPYKSKNDSKYIEHLEFENKWLREKYDELLKAVINKGEHGIQQGRVSG